MAKDETRDQFVPMMFPSELMRRERADPSAPQVTPARDAEEASAAGLELLVSDKGEGQAAPRAYVFRQARVVIGRSSICDLRLDDPKRIASGQHAAIVDCGDHFELIDLGSKNATFLNGEALAPEQPYRLGAGDTVEIGEFTIAIGRVAPPSAGLEDRTVLAPDAVNPFAEEAGELKAVLRRLAVRYAGEPAAERDEALSAALEAALAGDPPREVAGVLARLLARLSGGETG